MNIETKDHSRIKEFFHRLHSRLEDMMFSIIQKIPEKFISRFFMNWLDSYTTKRINELKQEVIKLTWRNIYLQDAVNDIRKSK